MSKVIGRSPSIPPMKLDYAGPGDARVAQEQQAQRQANLEKQNLAAGEQFPFGAQRVNQPFTPRPADMRVVRPNPDAPVLTRGDVAALSRRLAQRFPENGKRPSWGATTDAQLRDDMRGFSNMLVTLAQQYPELGKHYFHPPPGLALEEFKPYLARMERWFAEHPSAP